MARLKVMAIAVATGRIGYVFFLGGELCDWGLSRKASKNSTAAMKQVQKWVKRLNPDVIITEQMDKRSRKGEQATNNIEAIANLASDLKASDITVKREQRFQNKYEEAKALAGRFPDILPWVPKKRRIWQSEPPNITYFEALALALPVLRKAESSA